MTIESAADSGVVTGTGAEPLGRRGTAGSPVVAPVKENCCRFGILGFFVALAVFGPLVDHQDPSALSIAVLQPPSSAHWLGTTQTGQDVLAQLIVGTRSSLVVGFAVGRGRNIDFVGGWPGRRVHGWYDR